MGVHVARQGGCTARYMDPGCGVGVIDPCSHVHFVTIAENNVVTDMT